MPKRKAGIKRIRVDRKRRLKNIAVKQELKKALKKLKALLSSKSTQEAKVHLGKVFSLLDKAAKKNVIHSNTASRKKSRLSKELLKAA
jgi:small subunit ribosomal protein S20